MPQHPLDVIVDHWQLAGRMTSKPFEMRYIISRVNVVMKHVGTANIEL